MQNVEAKTGGCVQKKSCQVKERLRVSKPSVGAGLAYLEIQPADVHVGEAYKRPILYFWQGMGAEKRYRTHLLPVKSPQRYLTGRTRET